MFLRFTTQIGKIALLAIMFLPSFAMAQSKPTIDYQIMVQRATQAAI